jgi:predicted MPP superfamily phosphohydrolase
MSQFVSFSLSYVQQPLIHDFAVEKSRSHLIVGDMMEEIGLTARAAGINSPKL